MQRANAPERKNTRLPTGEGQNFQTDLIGNMVQPNLSFFLALKSQRQLLCLEFRWLTHKLTLDAESELHKE